ncbi:MAG: hypothetical protein Q4G59_01680 [Planctomycetia bacterium]|nr:hypothetical protein [Planctomycetia bacterium]
MKIVAKYSFNGGLKTIESQFADLYKELTGVIETVDASNCKTKESLEKTMPGRLLYSPKLLNLEIKNRLQTYGWSNYRLIVSIPPTIMSMAMFRKILTGLFVTWIL